ncbi:histidine phosphatase family protein [Deinococcus daejeonensis]|uniref:Alpha-ribazole phosphatase n=1 Tax=Deinococcus daejeonensis TaxID=1007098 RepID=A0ABQ2JKT0_9DEIO|nr:histidine phosphatase family protein [Deinococcus daejeonensis]GGN47902.1 alpha-ribazole phosphatase [Deinococcus daejeonensis]
MTALVTLVRHGRTAHNAAGRFQGWADVPLDEHGRTQAQSVARRLASHATRPTQVLSSDLQRAAQTAHAIAAPLGLTPHPTPALREIHIGAWEGLTFAEIEARDSAGFQAWPVRGAPQGESLHEVGARVRGVLDRLTLNSDGHVVIVTHGVAITALLCDVLGWDPQDTWRARRGLHDNTALTTLQRHGPGEWTCDVLACAEHLTLTLS